MKYDYNEVELKWQKKWDDNKTFKTNNTYDKKKFYGLVEFPYPSGIGLHLGHWRSYTAIDAYARTEKLLTEHIDKLHFVAEFLLKNESMDEEQFKAAMELDNPTIEDIEDIAFRKQKKSDDDYYENEV